MLRFVRFHKTLGGEKSTRVHRSLLGRRASSPRGGHLEVEDAGVALLEALSVGNHSVEEVVVQGQRGDGGQQPAVP